MTKEVAIQLKQGSKGGHIIFVFIDPKDKKEYVFTKGKREIVERSKMVGGDEILQVRLDLLNNAYRIKYNDDPKYKDADNDTYKRLAYLFTNHYQTAVVGRVKPNGEYDYKENGNLKVHLFDYIDETQNYLENVVTLKNLLRAENIVHRMDAGELRDTMFHFNYDPTDMKPSETLMKLVNHSNGIVLSRDKWDIVKEGTVERVRSVNEYFVNEYALDFRNEDSNSFLKNLCLKALIVKDKDTGMTSLQRKVDGYYIGGRHVGVEMHNVMNFLRANPRERLYVKEYVQKNDVIPPDDIKGLLEMRGFDVDKDEEKIVEKTQKVYVQGSPERIQFLKNLEKANTKFRAGFDESIGAAELEEFLVMAHKNFNAWSFHNLKTYLQENPKATYKQIEAHIAEVKAAKAKAREEKKLQTA